jgi:hypothetical protein
MMSILKMCPNAWHIKEFYGGYNGTCTQTSAAMCLASANGSPSDHDGVVNLMLAMTREMIAAGKAGNNGAATIANMAAEVRSRGGHTSAEVDYGGDRMGYDWVSLLRANAGVKPILLQLANAQAITDAYGHSQDGGVHYHAIAVLGIANEGYVVGDPNNPNVENAFDTYPLWTLTNASPCGLIMLDVKTPATLPAPPPADPAAQLAHFKAAIEAVLQQY